MSCAFVIFLCACHHQSQHGPHTRFATSSVAPGPMSSNVITLSMDQPQQQDSLDSRLEGVSLEWADVESETIGCV